MRITFLPSLIAPVSEAEAFGGAELAALALAEALAARGHRITLIGLAGSGGRGLSCVEAPHAAPLLRPGDTGSGAPAALTSREVFAPIERVLEADAAAGRIDALHLHCIDEEALLLADRLARRFHHLRVVATLHVAAVFPEAARGVAALIRGDSPIWWTTPSRFALESYGLETWPRAQVVPNGLELEQYRFEPRAPVDGHLAWVGRRSREKGLAEAVAIARRAGRRLVIAGPGAPEATQAERAAELQLLAGGDVEDRGRVGRPEVARILAGAAGVLVTSSIAETQSLVALEALAGGTPVIAYRGGALSDTIRDGVTGFVIPPVVERGAEAVARLEALSRARCREEAERRFSHLGPIEVFEKLYRRTGGGE